MREFLPRNAIVMALSKAPPSPAPQDSKKAVSVSFSGNLQSNLLFVREGSVNSDSEAAQTLFSKMLQAMGLSLESVLIGCLDQAVSTEELRTQLSSLDLKTIITLGENSARKLLAETSPLAELRNRPQRVTLNQKQIHVIPTFAPANLLEKPELKKQAWADLQKALV